MKIFHLFLLWSFISVCHGQNISHAELEKHFYFRDTLITHIDSTVFNNSRNEYKFSEKIQKEHSFLLKSSFEIDENKESHYRFHSIKRFDSAVAMTIIGPGYYFPELFLLTFDKDLKLIDKILLESSFVDAGEVDIYFCSPVNQSRYARTYLTEWESIVDKSTVIDSTVLIFQIRSNGKIESLSTNNFKREVKWD